MPADRGGIKQNVRAAQTRQARAFRIPLVPANQHADPPEARVEVGEPQVARREIKFFVIERVVGNVHLAVFSREGAVGIEHDRRVVVDAGGAALEQRADDDHAEAARKFREGVAGRAGDRLRQRKPFGVFFAAEIWRPEQFLQANDLCAAAGRLANLRFGFRQVVARILQTTHLNQADGEFFRHGGIIASIPPAGRVLPEFLRFAQKVVSDIVSVDGVK